MYPDRTNVGLLTAVVDDMQEWLDILYSTPEPSGERNYDDVPHAFVSFTSTTLQITVDEMLLWDNQMNADADCTLEKLKEAYERAIVRLARPFVKREERAALYNDGKGRPFPFGEPSLKREGLYQKYIISKVDGSPVDPSAVYFVLRLDNGCKDRVHLDACRYAALVYSSQILIESAKSGVNPLTQVAADLSQYVGKQGVSDT